MTYNEYYPTRHVVEKMNARNITWAEILKVVEKPEVSFGPDEKGRRVLQKDDLAVVVGSNNAIITVLLRDVDQWTDEDAQGRGRVAEVRLDSIILDYIAEVGSATIFQIMRRVQNECKDEYVPNQIEQAVVYLVREGKIGRTRDESSSIIYLILE